MSHHDVSLADLFRIEARQQATLLADGLLAVEDDPTPERLEGLMRAAHSVKGAARIVGHDGAVRLAHAMEDVFVAAQEGRVVIDHDRVDTLLRGVDLLASAASDRGDPADWSVANEDAITAVVDMLERQSHGPALTHATRPVDTPPPTHRAPAAVAPSRPPDPALTDTDERLLGYASEALVAARWLESHTGGAARTRLVRREMNAAIDQVREAVAALPPDERLNQALHNLRRTSVARADLVRQREEDLDAISRRVQRVAGQLYEQVVRARMRPFGEGTMGFPRMVRDVARELQRDVRFEVRGESTPVDREVLRRLDGPLGHLLRNAIDHGVEPPAERERRGKPQRGTILLEARHGGGRLIVSVEDDGRGVDLDQLRLRVAARQHIDDATAAAMSADELLEFLFLPGFSMSDAVTAISGRGVGLDAVQTAVRDIGGTVRMSTTPGSGTRFELQLPLTLSVVRALVVEIGAQAYAVPLARVNRVLRVARSAILSTEGRQHFTAGDRQIGLVWAHQILGLDVPMMDEDLAVMVLDDHEVSYGIAVDRLAGERELVLRGLDPRLGKVQDVAAAALLPDGSPVLVLDVDDVVRSVANLISGGRLDRISSGATLNAIKRRRVLVVDDSLTVRELERKMIEQRGYDVDVAVDGIDGWNAVRTGHYDLVVTDVDMPRLDGIELVTLIKADAALRNTPVMIVSYKDRDEDRRRGLEAGADYYLTKGSFYDETMLRAIDDLIGHA